MSRGIYIVANDKVIESAIALLNSIRLYNCQVPVFLIPFDDNYQQVAADSAVSTVCDCSQIWSLWNSLPEKLAKRSIATF